jgi:hypothetical protein
VFPWQHIGPGVSTRPITTKNNTAAMSVELWLSALFWQWGGRSSNVIIKLSTNEMTCTAKLLSTTETEAATYNYQPTLSFFFVWSLIEQSSKRICYIFEVALTTRKSFSPRTRTKVRKSTWLKIPQILEEKLLTTKNNNNIESQILMLMRPGETNAW